MSNKLHILVKTSYGDFDAPVETPILASYDKGVLESKQSELNAARTSDEIDEWISYDILPDSIKII